MSEARRPRILIADDREENRYVLCRVLTGAGYECLEAGTGAEAMEIAQTLPDVIILDVRLPDISGYEVCRKIKQDPRTAVVSILQISASFVSSEDRVKALEAGADGYLTHPIDRLVLVATVRALLRLRTAEAVARKSAEQWQSTFDALAEGLALLDTQGRLVRWNGAFEEICGSRSQIRAGDDAAVFLGKVLRLREPLGLEDVERFRQEFAIDRKTVQLTVSRFASQNGESDKIVILSDITDRRLAEYALRTAEKLAATGKLANAIAHEINNPLEALVNLIYLASSSHSLDQIHDFLAQAHDELDRVTRITKQTLSFHRDTQSPVPIDVGALVAETVSVYARPAAARRVRVVCEGRPTMAIYGFPGQLSQIFGNLIRNATEAALPDTEVTVRVRPVQRAGRDGTRVTVHDRGCGIPETVRAKLFDPFFTTKDLKGSGLGLWVSKNLVMKHDGTIRFRSSERAGSSGTTFEVFLPAGGLSHQRAMQDGR
jgi:two-component system NtrC family sensor kinase